MRLISLFIPLTALLLLAAAGSAQAELGFKNKKSKMLHLDCSKSVNRPSAYTCFDGNGGETYLDEGQEWELFNHQKVCFRHKEDDRILVCYELTMPGSAAKSYACSRKDSYFEPGKDWELMPGSNAICTEQIKHYEVPKKMEFSISGME
jgi:hypothetical protein